MADNIEVKNEFAALDIVVSESQHRIEVTVYADPGSSQNYADLASSYADAAEASATEAATSAQGVETYATQAQASATAAATSESNAAQSETNAAASVNAASNSETAAATSESNAAAHETAAGQSAAAAATSESNAADSATAAGLSETNAAGSASAAGASETNAAASASAAGTSETNAAGSASAAGISETNAAASETAAGLSESNAATSETNANASAVAAGTSETNAAGSASAASTSETNAADSAAAAAVSETNVADHYDDFRGRWMGDLASEPTTRPDGSALEAGDVYFNTTSDTLQRYDGSAFDVPYDVPEANTSTPGLVEAAEDNEALVGQEGVYADAAQIRAMMAQFGVGGIETSEFSGDLSTLNISGWRFFLAGNGYSDDPLGTGDEDGLVYTNFDNNAGLGYQKVIYLDLAGLVSPVRTFERMFNDVGTRSAWVETITTDQGLLTANRLSEIADEGAAAQEFAQENLGITVVSAETELGGDFAIGSKFIATKIGRMVTLQCSAGVEEYITSTSDVAVSSATNVIPAMYRPFDNVFQLTRNMPPSGDYLQKVEIDPNGTVNIRSDTSTDAWGTFTISYISSS